MRLIGVLFLFLIGAPTCWGVPIVFTHEGSGSGTLGGTPLVSTPFVVTAHGDTANRQSVGFDVYFIDHDSARIDLTGIGTFEITSGTRTFVNQTGSIVGLSRGGASGGDLFNSPNFPVYGSWNMLSSIGPHFGLWGLFQWDLMPHVTTTGGTLFFNNEFVPGAFTARIVPEPGAAMLAMAALVGMMHLRGLRLRQS